MYLSVDPHLLPHFFVQVVKLLLLNHSIVVFICSLYKLLHLLFSERFILLSEHVHKELLGLISVKRTTFIFVVFLESLVDTHSYVFALRVSLAVLGFLLIFVLFETARTGAGDTSPHNNKYK
jgi:hypothetical protein